MFFLSIQWLKWLVYTNDVEKLWAAQPTFLISQAVYIVAGVITLIHGNVTGGIWLNK